MPKNKIVKIALIGLTLAILFLLVFALYYLLLKRGDYLKTPFVGKNNHYAKIIKFESPGDFLDRKEMEFELPGFLNNPGQKVKVDVLELKIRSSGEITNVVLNDKDDSALAEAQVLKVFIDNNEEGKELDEFFIVVGLYPLEDRDTNIASMLLYTFVQQDKINSIIDTAGDKASSDVIEDLSKVDLQNVNINELDLNSLFAEGKRYTIYPYQNNQLTNYLSSNGSDQKNIEYYNIAKKYYLEQDAVIVSSDGSELSIVKDPVFLLF